jgi:peptide/nickel transport system substrate-binding protein
MIPKRRFLAAAAASAALVLSACSSSSGGASADNSAGKPVAGGTARVIQVSEPRSLDPAAMSNAWPLNAFLGNALYGALMINDPKTGEIIYKMAEDFSSADGGKTFELKLRPGLKFSDGSPLDAEAVKYNWDRIKDPSLGSSSMQDAMLISSTEVLDATTLKVTMATPVPNYAHAVVFNAMNWIASPKVLEAGQQAFNANPVGAGPYTLKKWTRQDTIELVKNPNYWDSPKPYLDAITLRTASDSSQRFNTVVSRGADVAIDSNWATIAKAKDAGLPVDVAPLNGGQYLAMNTRRAPFDDVRARKAVAAALDFDAVNSTVYSGKGQVPRTLFTESSPFYSDLELQKTDPATAQRLFDELAAEGKPVSFTFKSFATPEAKAVAESVQAQLSAFKNATVKIVTVDLAEVGKLRASHDFDMIISSALFTDPEPRLFSVFHGDSSGNVSGIDDEQLNAALQDGRTATSVEERKAAYEVVQQRLIELTPVIFYTRAAPAAIAAENVHGVVQYGQGSLLPEELWMQK